MGGWRGKSDDFHFVADTGAFVAAHDEALGQLMNDIECLSELGREAYFGDQGDSFEGFFRVGGSVPQSDDDGKAGIFFGNSSVEVSSAANSASAWRPEL